MLRIQAMDHAKPAKHIAMKSYMSPGLITQNRLDLAVKVYCGRVYIFQQFYLGVPRRRFVE
jgi:hypothetical protein